MKTLSESMNTFFGEREGAYILKNVHIDFDAHDALCLICAEFDMPLDNYADSDFDSAGIALADFCSGPNEETGYTVSVWFD